MERLIEMFHSKPLLVFWETTKACPLACRHCRADAILKPLPGELTTEEGKRLLDQITGFGAPYPIVVFTGGDPLARPDIFELMEYAASRGIGFALSPAVSPNLTDEALLRARELGVRVISISLDGASPETHDELRGVKGSFRDTVDAIRRVVELGINVQVNTVVWRKSLRELPRVVKLIWDLGVRVWEVFFLIPVGRGSAELDITPREYEDVLNFLVDVSTYGMQVRTVEAPFYRRVKLQRARGSAHASPLYEELRGELARLMGPPTGRVDPRIMPTRDGFGILFVAHDGTVYPSGFLPYPLGNVRKRNIVDIYRNHELLIAMRTGKFGGRCGVCEYRDVCGGSRARAYAVLGDPLGEDPACIYTPPAFQEPGGRRGLSS